MERKRNPARKSVDVDAAQYDQLAAHAKAREQAIVTLVRRALAEWLAKQEAPPEPLGEQKSAQLAPKTQSGGERCPELATIQATQRRG